MFNDFMNGFEKFKEKYDNMSDDEFLSLFVDAGIEFVPIEVESKKVTKTTLQKKCCFNFELNNKYINMKQLIA